VAGKMSSKKRKHPLLEKEKKKKEVMEVENQTIQNSLNFNTIIIYKLKYFVYLHF
jgi:hypothetical protein